MAIEVTSVGSSSSGNSYIIRTGSVNILLDAGLSARRIIGAISECGMEPDDIDAVLITHEHIDHVRSIRAIGKKCSRAVFVTSRGTYEAAENFRYIPDERLVMISSGGSIVLGPEDEEDSVTVRAFSLSHDAAEPLGFSVTSCSSKLAVVTDTGIVTDDIYGEIRDADMLVFEANHDEGLLMYGSYPYSVKMRIKSDHGHLSNDYAGNVIARVLADRRSGPGCSSGPLALMLAHLSFNNNAPFYARTTIEGILNRQGFEKGSDYSMVIASRDETTVLKQLISCIN